jgi:NAD(P)-dependent dehydrogenase (short-subunit alcohol dehydrogenase family)
MQLKLKPLSEQTIVITGATSGIGLCTARLAAESRRERRRRRKKRRRTARAC